MFRRIIYIMLTIVLVCGFSPVLPVNADDEGWLHGGYKWEYVHKNITYVIDVTGFGDDIYVLHNDGDKYMITRFDENFEIIKEIVLEKINKTDYFEHIFSSESGTVYVGCYSHLDDDYDNYEIFTCYKLDGNNLVKIKSYDDFDDHRFPQYYNTNEFWVFELENKFVIYSQDQYDEDSKIYGGYVIGDLKTGKIVSGKATTEFHFDENGSLIYNSHTTPDLLMKYYTSAGLYEISSFSYTFTDLSEYDFADDITVDYCSLDEHGNLIGYDYRGKKTMLLNCEANEIFLEGKDKWCSLRNGNILLRSGNNVLILKKNDEKFPDQNIIKVYANENMIGTAERYVNAFNDANSDYIAILDSSDYNADIIISSIDNYWKTTDIYELMGEDFFDPDEILMHILESNETDGKLLSISPDWRFDIMIANADIVPDGAFKSIEAMKNLDISHNKNSVKNEYGEVLENRLFYTKTRYETFDLLFPFIQTDMLDWKNKKASINREKVEDLLEFSRLYKTSAEYEKTEDYEKYRRFSILPYTDWGYRYYFDYPYNRQPPYEIDQFDIAAFRDGRYAAAIFNGETIPIDSTGSGYDFFRNFSSFAYMLFDGNISYPGFFGLGSVMVTPINAVKISVPANTADADAAKKYIAWLLKGSESALSISALKAGADLAVNTPRTHERNGITVRDTAYFSENDFFIFPDVTRAEMDRLLDEIISHSFAAPNSFNTMENILKADPWLNKSVMNNANVEGYLSGDITLEEFCKAMEDASETDMAFMQKENYFFADESGYYF